MAGHDNDDMSTDIGSGSASRSARWTACGKRGTNDSALTRVDCRGERQARRSAPKEDIARQFAQLDGAAHNGCSIGADPFIRAARARNCLQDWHERRGRRADMTTTAVL
eukprot:4695195-Pyramimonas_sp.AAC.1